MYSNICCSSRRCAGELAASDVRHGDAAGQRAPPGGAERYHERVGGLGRRRRGVADGHRRPVSHAMRAPQRVHRRRRGGLHRMSARLGRRRRVGKRRVNRRRRVRMRQSESPALVRREGFIKPAPAVMNPRKN